MENLLTQMGATLEKELTRSPRPPTRHSRQERISLNGDHLTYITNRLNAVGLYKFEGPITPDHCYFEIEIVEAGIRTAIGIGLVPYMYPMDCQPGWQPFSVGYHADDGNLFKGEGGSGCPFGPRSSVGDRMGCGVKINLKGAGGYQQADVFFTRNGLKIGTVTVPYPPGGLYPAVGLHSDGEQVRLNLDAAWHEETVALCGEKLTISKHYRHERVVIDGEYLSYVQNPMNTVGLFIAANNLSPEKSYFEIEIIDAGKKSAIGIGLVPYDYPMDCQPGWKQFSIGYHADDGNLFKAVEHGPFGPQCKAGDRMGCGIKFKRNEGERWYPEETHHVFFTKNGVEIGTVTVPNPEGGLYPAVGLHSKGEKVRLNMDAVLQSLKQNLNVHQDRVDSSKKMNALETVNEWLELLKLGIKTGNYVTSFDTQSHPELHKTCALLEEISNQLQENTSKFQSTIEGVNAELQLLKRDIDGLSAVKSTLAIEEAANDDTTLIRILKQLRKELCLKKEIFTSNTRGSHNESLQTHSIHDLDSDEVNTIVTDVCAFCAGKGKLNTAQHYCKDCSQFERYICGVCKENHDMFTDNHKVERISTSSI